MTPVTDHLEHLLLPALTAAVAAGKAVLDVYRTPFDVAIKEDGSPLTLADRQAHGIITTALSGLQLPLLSEEGKNIPYGQRKDWRTFWLVDPLDGTKEFVHRRGEFTVNIALIQDRFPVLGVIFVPTRHLLYFGGVAMGAHRARLEPDAPEPPGGGSTAADWMAIAERLPFPHRGSDALVIIGSRSHGTDRLNAFVAEQRRSGRPVEFISAGSSLKFCRIAEGSADLYPRFGPTMEWDTAAGQAIAESAGASVRELESDQRLIYNKERLLNPWFVVSRLSE